MCVLICDIGFDMGPFIIGERPVIENHSFCWKVFSPKYWENLKFESFNFSLWGFKYISH